MAAYPRTTLSVVAFVASLCLGATPTFAQTTDPARLDLSGLAAIDMAPSAAPEEAVPVTADAELAYAKSAGIEFTTIKAEAADRVNTSDHLSCDSKMAKLLDSPQGREVLERRIPDVVSDPRIVMARGLTLKQLAKHKQAGITPEVMAEIDQDLSAAATAK